MLNSKLYSRLRCLPCFSIILLVIYGIVLLMVLYYYYLSGALDEPFGTNPTPESNISDIPFNIFQTWHTKQLPKHMAKCVESLKLDNPEFTYYLFDDNDCLSFLRDNFEPEVLHAYQSLKPGAYKADLWRYCVLYKYGGVYIDIKYHCVNGFTFMDLMDDEYFVCDNYDALKQLAVYNAFMICKPGNEILKKCIIKCVDNVNQKYYGNNPLEVTGPLLMIQFFHSEDRQKLNRLQFIHNDSITLNGKVILEQYPEYRQEQSAFANKTHYDTLWHKRDCFV